MVKEEKPPLTKKCMEACILSQILLDLRALCSQYQNYTPKSNIAKQIYKYLEQIDKTHLFNVSNFDPNLLQTCRESIRLQSTRPAYLLYDANERLETEQAQILQKFNLPIYPEHEDVIILKTIRQLIRQALKDKNKDEGDKNGNAKKQFEFW